MRLFRHPTGSRLFVPRGCAEGPEGEVNRRAIVVLPYWALSVAYALWVRYAGTPPPAARTARISTALKTNDGEHNPGWPSMLLIALPIGKEVVSKSRIAE
jgi:hypothetical protein